MKKKYITIIGLFIIVLTLSRMLWVDMLHDVSRIEIEDGYIELIDWDANDNEILLLDGEWEFYPSTFLYDKDGSIDRAEENKQLLHVPDGWNIAFGDESQAYGFGSYLLRMSVDPDADLNFSLYIPSVRSSSEVYVNGRLVANSGEVGRSKESYQAKNLPYTTTVTADEYGEIEIVVQAANFQDVRRSGIVRSIQFGSEAAIMKERYLSLSMQVLAAGLLVLHAIYSSAIFLLGNRDKRLIFFSLFLLSVTLMSLISSDDKIFHFIFNISYEWDFRLANVLVPIASYALFRCLDEYLIPYWHVVNPIYLAVNVMMGILTISSSPEQIISYFPVYVILLLFAIVVTIYVIVRNIYINMTGNLLLLLSFIAIVHDLFWTLYWRETGISVVHYPFDYMISLGLFTLIWFKQYFEIHAATKRQALELQAKNDHKDQFLANTAHEFKNPLHGMINMSQSVLIRENQVIERSSVHELESIGTIGNRLSLLLNDLLDVESFKMGLPRIKRRRIRIQPVVQGVLDMLQFTVDMKSVMIHNEISEDFPAIYADESRVVQVLHNLIHNAIKFTDEGDVYIRAEIKGERAFIHIADTGMGIDEDFLERLFVPYEQMEREGVMDSGFGLGLTVSKQLIELHGGDLEVVSNPGEGSEFTFSFELALEENHDEVASSLHELVKEDADKTSLPLLKHPINRETGMSLDIYPHKEIGESERLQVLVVDDDPVNLQVLESILSFEPYDVTAVLSGEEALKRLNKKDWSLVITDVMMPGMSGYKLTKEIRQRYSIIELPVLLLTAMSTPRDMQAGFVVGANDYVTKPVDRRELLSRVQALTTLKKAIREQLHLEAIWLQAQIQPHFLFNTLNSLVALSEIDVERMRGLLHDFSEFLRSKYQFHHIDGLVPMEEELNIVKSYLKIEQVRFGNRLDVVWNIDERAMVDVPFLTIQPLVENAINHGVMERLEGGKVVISVIGQEDGVLVSVADDGVGIEEEKLTNLLNRKTNDRSSVGLVNTNQRIIKNFGHGLKIKSKVDEGTTVSFLVPKR